MITKISTGREDIEVFPCLSMEQADKDVGLSSDILEEAPVEPTGVSGASALRYMSVNVLSLKCKSYLPCVCNKER